jgi:hypothetical protein
MRRATAILSALALVVMTAGLYAQAKPNFAGKWTLVPDAAAADAGGAGGGGGRGRGGRGGFGQEMTVTQDANTLTIEYMAGGQNPMPVKLTYKLDGSESNNKKNAPRAHTDQHSNAPWKGNTRDITTTTQICEQKRVL